MDRIDELETRIMYQERAIAELSAELYGQSDRLAAAERLGTDAVRFPGDHGGFLGGEYGQRGDPEAFAAKLREVLSET